MALVNLERDGAIATVTLNRPEAMNALSGALMVELEAALKEADEDPAIRAIILTGAGERAFCAGLDLKELGQFGLSLSPTGVRQSNAILAPTRCKTPVIGAINGVAATGGFELALACDMLIASTKARFGDTHVRVGVTAGARLSQALSRVIGVYRAKEMSLSGNYIDAQQALAWGLVGRVVEPDQLMPAARALADSIAQNDPDMVVRYKSLIDDGFALAYGDGLALEKQRSEADNVKVKPESVAERRAAIQERARKQ